MDYTCDELILRHPDAVMWGWDSKKIGVFYRCLLINGSRFGKNKRVLVDENSFTLLMEFAYHSRLKYHLIMGDQEESYFSYEEVMTHFPEASHYRWNNTVIGVLCTAKLLKGKWCSKEAKKLVSVASVSDLIDFTNNRFLTIANLRKQG